MKTDSFIPADGSVPHRSGSRHNEAGAHRGKRRVAAICIFLLAVFLPFPAGSESRSASIAIGHFSKLPMGTPAADVWAPMLFRKRPVHTQYRIVSDHGTRVLEAKSRSAASGLIRRQRVDPDRFPVLAWRWKTNGAFHDADGTRKSGDDYPLRVYVLFENDAPETGFLNRLWSGVGNYLAGRQLPQCAISYVWAGRGEINDNYSNPYTDQVKMIVLQSGPEHANAWKTETRNVAADYRRAFGEPPPPIAGVAVMTDTDDTGSSAVSYYGDITFFSGMIGLIDRDSDSDPDAD